MANTSYLPLGSEIEEIDEQFIVTPPEGWEYIGYDIKGNYIRLAGSTGSISCTCNVKGKCVPFKASIPAGDFAGCSGDCKNCTMTQKQNKIDINTGGYINLSIEPYIIDEKEQLPAVFSAMYETDDVIKIINSFLDKIYQGKEIPPYIDGDNSVIAPDGYSITMVNICGRATPLLLPNDSIPTGKLAASSSSCSCTKGSCKLIKKSMMGYGVTFCDGNCTGTCTLTLSAKEIIYEATCFDF